MVFEPASHVTAFWRKYNSFAMWQAMAALLPKTASSVTDLRDFTDWQPDVVEAPRIPQQHEVAAKDLFAEDVALLGINLGSEGFLGHAPGAAELHAGDCLAVGGLGEHGRGRGSFQFRGRLLLILLLGGRNGLKRIRGGDGLGWRLSGRSSGRLLLLGRLLLCGPHQGRTEAGRRYARADMPEEPHRRIPLHSALIK